MERPYNDVGGRIVARFVARLIWKILVLVGILAVARLLRGLVPWSWVFVLRLGFGAALAIYVAALSTRLRNAAIVLATVLLSLAAIEAWAVVEVVAPGGSWPNGLFAERAELGWGPDHPGTFVHVVIDAKTGRTVYDVEYTIDANLDREVDSAPDGPAVAFFGDSFTFGLGLPDADTLPQAFADTTGRRIRVLNLGIPGYGPAQFLRALETGMYDQLLNPSRLFVFETAAWHAERSACKFGFAPQRAPRYLLVGAEPTYAGTCARSWYALAHDLFGLSATYRTFVVPLLSEASATDIDLYIAILIRAGRLARERYGVPTIILYLPYPDYARQAGTTDEEIVRRLRAGGLWVIDGALDPSAFPGQPLVLGDGHPTGVANRARALLLRDVLASRPPPPH